MKSGKAQVGSQQQDHLPIPQALNRLGAALPRAEMQTFIQTRTQLIQQITETELVKEVRVPSTAPAVLLTTARKQRSSRPSALLYRDHEDAYYCTVLTALVQELGRLDDSAVVYKLIGPAMIKQDLLEANTNVSKRLEYINGEVKRISGKLAELEGRSKEQQQLVSVGG